MPANPMSRLANAGFYTYAAFFTAIPAGGGSQSQTITIDQDADFDAVMQSFFAYEATADNQTDATRILPNATVEMFTQDTQKMTNIPVPIAALFGSGEAPMVLPRARRFEKQTLITLKVTNNDPSAVLNLWLNLIGNKVYG